MGDRTWVNIHFRESDYKRIVNEDFEGNEDKFANSVYFEEKVTSDYGKHIIMLYASEVNYAEWSELEGILRDKEIEFNKEWGDGGDYSAGEAFYRKVNGKYKSMEIYSSQQSEINVLEELSKVIEEGGDLKKVKSFINKRIKQYKPFEPEPLHRPNSVRFINED